MTECWLQIGEMKEFQLAPSSSSYSLGFLELERISSFPLLQLLLKWREPRDLSLSLNRSSDGHLLPKPAGLFIPSSAVSQNHTAQGTAPLNKGGGRIPSILSEIFSKLAYLMKTFGLIGLTQMECDGSDARGRGIYAPSQILCCWVYLALINAVMLYTQLDFPNHKTCCLQFSHSNTLLAAQIQTNRVL